MPVALPPPLLLRVDNQCSTSSLLQRERKGRYRVHQAASSLTLAGANSPVHSATLSQPLPCPSSAAYRDGDHPAVSPAVSCSTYPLSSRYSYRWCTRSRSRKAGPLSGDAAASATCQQYIFMQAHNTGWLVLATTELNHQTIDGSFFGAIRLQGCLLKASAVGKAVPKHLCILKPILLLQKLWLGGRSAMVNREWEERPHERCLQYGCERLQ